MKKIPRTHIEGAIYYITSRGDNNREIFKDQNDYLMYINVLKKYKEQYEFKLFAFCLLPNHLHLLIELKEGITISDIMHDLNSNYTKYFNGRYNRKGHLFKERNRTILAEKTSFLLPMTAYIHLNPKANGLVSDVKDYAYSSYHSIIGDRLASLKAEFQHDGIQPLGCNIEGQTNVWVPEGLNLNEEAREISECLKGKSYADFLSSVTKNEIEILGKDLAKKLILGSEEFMAKVEQKMEKALAENRKPETVHRKFILAGSLAILILGIITLYLYRNTLGLKENFKKELLGKEAELTGRLAKEKAKIYEDLDEKYRADMVSYQAMAKRLEIEKGKVKELEGKVK